MRRAFIHDPAKLADAAKYGKPLRLEFNQGATTIRLPNGQQVLEKRHPRGKAARKAAKVVRREIRARMSELTATEKAELATQIAALGIEKGGAQ